MAKQTLSDTQLKDLYRRAGIQPAQQTTGTGPSQTAQETEDLFAKRLKSIQAKQDALEEKLTEAQTAEGIYRRQTEIYNNRYTDNKKLRKQSKAIQDAMDKLSPQQIYLMEAMEASAGIRQNPYFATPDDKGDIQQAKELMDAIIKNKGTGKQLDLIGLAANLQMVMKGKQRRYLVWQSMVLSHMQKNLIQQQKLNRYKKTQQMHNLLRMQLRMQLSKWTKQNKKLQMPQHQLNLRHLRH